MNFEAYLAQTYMMVLSAINDELCFQMHGRMAGSTSERRK